MEHQETSREAFLSLDTKIIDGRVLGEIMPDGATCDEVEVSLGGRHQTISSAVNRIMKSGLVKDSGIRRKTRSGRKAIVWVPTKVVWNNWKTWKGTYE